MVSGKKDKKICFQELMWSTGNEHEVGQGIKDSGVPRENIFVTSKLWNTHQNNVAEGLKRTLEALDTDYLDLYVSRPSFSSNKTRNARGLFMTVLTENQLVHWPVRLVPVSRIAIYI